MQRSAACSIRQASTRAPIFARYNIDSMSLAIPHSSSIAHEIVLQRRTRAGNILSCRIVDTSPPSTCVAPSGSERAGSLSPRRQNHWLLDPLSFAPPPRRIFTARLRCSFSAAYFGRMAVLVAVAQNNLRAKENLRSPEDSVEVLERLYGLRDLRP